MEVGSFWGRHEGTRCGARWGFRFGGSHLQRWTKTNENKGRHWTERIPLGEFPPTVASTSSTYCTVSLGIVSFGLLQQVCRLQFFPPPWIAHRSYNIPRFHFPLLPKAVFHGPLSGSRNFRQIKGRIRKLVRYGIFLPRTRVAQSSPVRFPLIRPNSKFSIKDHFRNASRKRGPSSEVGIPSFVFCVARGCVVYLWGKNIVLSSDSSFALMHRRTRHFLCIEHFSVAWRYF